MDAIGEKDTQRTTHLVETIKVINNIEVHIAMQTNVKTNEAFHNEGTKSKQADKSMSTTKNPEDMATRAVDK